MIRTHAGRAELALLLEVASTPTLGNVDRHRDLDGLRFEHFLAGAVGARRGLRRAEAGEPIGRAFLRAVEGMADQRGGNTQFGCLLLLVPLVRAAAAGSLTADGVTEVVAATTVEDAADFYRSFDVVDVYVDDPPDGADDLDVRRGADAIPSIEADGITMFDVMSLAAGTDDVAREWTNGFPRSFEAADRIRTGSGTVLDRGARAHLELLGQRPDTLVAKEHGMETAKRLQRTARRLLEGDDRRTAVDAAATEFVAAGINPGTTADILAAGLYIALERGEAV